MRLLLGRASSSRSCKQLRYMPTWAPPHGGHGEGAPLRNNKYIRVQSPLIHPGNTVPKCVDGRPSLWQRWWSVPPPQHMYGNGA